MMESRGFLSGADFPAGRLLLLACLLSLSVSRAWGAEINCEVDYGNQLQQMVVAPGNDPYEMQQLDPGGGFRFSAQYLLPASKLKTYVYQESKARMVLIHAAEYPLPDCHADAPVTGLNRVYSPQLERELLFRCWQDCR